MSTKNEIRAKDIPAAVVDDASSRRVRDAERLEEGASLLREQAHNLDGGNVGLVALAGQLHELGFALGHGKGRLTAASDRGRVNISAATPEALVEKARRQAGRLARLPKPPRGDYDHVGKAA